MLLGGRLSDLFGRKLTFIVGLAGFALASAVGGPANGFEMLVFARAAQGVFGALPAPAALLLLTTNFSDPKERGKAFGIFGAIAGAGGAIGLLTEYLDWRWCLYVNLVFAAVALVGAIMFLVPGRHAERPSLDFPGTIVDGGDLRGGRGRLRRHAPARQARAGHRQSRHRRLRN